ncbi:type 1 fimbrial protein [Proteus vulgaris]|uniref:Type 1 fimbrial protein n=1 Tax=Proteus faecis TaxID=2050967 RepID=A0ABZ3EME7_9GAMM|nr:fimbrial protein [Proteus faecis]MCT8249671.1 type 1 fimbrial protein [Proteus faecis]QNH65233.1 type 1 fimbrial protein [Proteus vulgaris]
MKKLISLLSLLLVTSYTYSSTEQGHGRVDMRGTIVETPCLIDTGSADQSIDLGIIPISYMSQYGASPEKAFSIKLIDCQLVSTTKENFQWESFDVTFDGANNGNYYTVNGDAKGVVLQIKDTSEQLAIPGKSMDKIQISPGDMFLNYKLRLIADGSDIRAGDFHTIIIYRISYY